MNLEQIKNRQGYINDSLEQLLKDFIQTVNFISGEYISTEGSTQESISPNGIVENIIYSQQRTETFIRELHNELNRLNKKTYDNESDLAKLVQS